jgi:hypothetical protein
MTLDRLAEINRTSNEIESINNEIELITRLLKNKNSLVLEISSTTNKDSILLTQKAYSEEITKILEDRLHNAKIISSLLINKFNQY